MPNENARRLRLDSTDAERRLWAVLRDRRLARYRFRRQHPIGGFIVDFASTKHRLIVEADGSQHADNEADERRTVLLQDGAGASSGSGTTMFSRTPRAWLRRYYGHCKKT